ncbi:MAG: RluA family pseudouridine synthase [Phycisphaerae bacterium]|nr:RluA family pseudouridine synthase [Phycisphaerae bacterium]
MTRDSEDILDRPVPLDEESDEVVTVRIRQRVPGRRIDKYLHGRFARMSRTLIQRLIKQGAITVNGKPTKPSYELTAGDEVQMTVPQPEPYDVVPEDIPVNVVYEDSELLGVNKQAGIVCHPARATQTGTLANGLAYYAERLSKGDDPFRPGIVHRLDKQTTGIMLVAKTDEAHWRLALQFEQRTTQKMYLAIVEGSPQLDADIINAPIGNHPRIKDKRVVPGPRQEAKDVKEAVTRYEVVERLVGFTLVHLYPKTGRTHQLRVHMSHIGHSMLGDPMYGGHFVTEAQLSGREDDSRDPILVRQALHAYRITFRHPIREQEMTLEAPPPEDFERALALLRKYRQI